MKTSIRPWRMSADAGTKSGRSLAGSLVRSSLRVNVVLLVLAMLLLPPAIVVAWSFMERDIGGRLQWSAHEAAEEAASTLARARDEKLDSAATEDRLDDVAARFGARIRVVDEDGREQFDVDHDKGTDLVHQVGTLFFGADGAPTLREFDDALEPVPARPEVLRVTRWKVREPVRMPAVPLEGSARAPSPTPTSSPSPPPRARASDDTIDTGCRSSPAGKLLVCHAALSLRDASGTQQVIYVQGSSRRAVRALYDLRYQVLRLAALMLPLALAFSWWMGRRMVRPIEDLRARVLEKARSANPRADLTRATDDEAGFLADAFNDLLGALDEKRRANEAFVADLVHEFKNPVAAIRACSDALAKGGVDEKRATRLANILADSSARLDGLVSQFLELARAEAGMPNEIRTAVDLTALARGVVASIEPRFPDVHFDVVAEADHARGATEDATVVHGVLPRLESVIRNLVDNAASFAGAGGDVVVRIGRTASHVRLEVSDTGPGIAEPELSRVFERFYTTRATAGESHARTHRGTGLGLALVKAVAEAHGGTVDARARGPAAPGTVFRVDLPIVPPDAPVIAGAPARDEDAAGSHRFHTMRADVS